MDALKWRDRARGAAIGNLILTSTFLFIVIVITVCAGAFTVVVNSPEIMNKIKNSQGQQWESVDIDPATRELLTNGVWFIWLAVAITAVLIGIQMWAAIKLMNATDLGTQLPQVLGKAATWRNVTVVFLSFEILAMGFAMNDYRCMIALILVVAKHSTDLFIVNKFMLGINSLLAKSSTPGPNEATAEV